MPLIPVDQAGGRRLASTIRGSRGQVLLRAGVVLTEDLLARLRIQHGMAYVPVRNAVLPDLPIIDVDLDLTVRAQAVEVLKSTIDALQEGRPITNAADVHTAAEAIVDAVLQTDGIPVALSILRSQEDGLFQHSINTAAYSALIGIGGGLSRQDLVRMSLGGLLHDLGKARIPVEILTKPGRLTPEEMAIMQTHPQIGFEAIVKDLPGVAPQVAAVAFQHHERLNGSGYVLGLRGSQIHRFARIVAVADVYDALCAVRPYKPAWPPHRAAGFLWKHPELFDGTFVARLLARVAAYPAGAIVRLADGALGTVVQQNPGRPMAPVVLVVADHHNRVLREPVIRGLTADEQAVGVQAVLRRWPTGVLEQVDLDKVHAVASEALRIEVTARNAF